MATAVRSSPVTQQRAHEEPAVRVKRVVSHQQLVRFHQYAIQLRLTAELGETAHKVTQRFGAQRRQYVLRQRRAQRGQAHHRYAEAARAHRQVDAQPRSSAHVPGVLGCAQRRHGTADRVGAITDTHPRGHDQAFRPDPVSVRAGRFGERRRALAEHQRHLRRAQVQCLRLPDEPGEVGESPATGNGGPPVRGCGRAGPVVPAGFHSPTPRAGQSRVNLRWVTRCGRAASAPRRSILFFS
ncbi:hypothetical protein ATK36_5434 [Amycolatopsis sulphurea]|uniref:Uncharacterized protein n=1 Tax=Amycolatopsis sulphurea TaxID=76022 RepID=A0A2A9FHL1_9PSEU|nr:hypothetical protein ATK36_5434 [Amycolatopsis sulphurea]